MTQPPIPDDQVVRMRTFYRASLALPIVAAGVAMLLGRAAGDMPRPLGELIAWLILSGVCGGLPYLVLAAGAFRWMRDRTEREIRRAALWSPLLMIGAYAVECVAYGLLGDVFGQATHAGPIFVLGSECIVIFGYVYVAIVLALGAAIVPPRRAPAS